MVRSISRAHVYKHGVYVGTVIFRPIEWPFTGRAKDNAEYYRWQREGKISPYVMRIEMPRPKEWYDVEPLRRL